MNVKDMDQFLLLERVEESSDAFRRIGLGHCDVKNSLFRETSEKRAIMLK